MTLREVYKTYFSFSPLDGLIKAVLNNAVTFIARVKGFYFPKNYVRQQRWEMLTGRYEPDSVAVFRSLITPGMVVVDIGAHIGYFTRLFSGYRGKREKYSRLKPTRLSSALKKCSKCSNVVARQVAVVTNMARLTSITAMKKAGAVR